MFDKIIRQEGGIAASNVCLQALPHPFPFPFVAIFSPKQRACSRATFVDTLPQPYAQTQKSSYIKGIQLNFITF